MTQRHLSLCRRAGAAVAVVLTAAAAPLAWAGPAEAVGYRYWSFCQADGDSWAYARQGPSISRPLDGSVEGWRFAVSEDAADRARQPRGPRRFAEICADTPEKAGTKRVALILDFGTAADAPGGETPPKRRTACARVREDATSAEALAAAAAPLRYDSVGMLCAIEGFPATGCGDTVAGGDPEGATKPSAADAAGRGRPGTGGDDTEEGTDGGPAGAVGLVAGVGAVVALGAAAAWRARRRS